MKLTDRASIGPLVESMSLDEKVSLLLGVSFFRTRGMDEYGIPEVFFLDGGTGFNLMQAAIDAFSRIRPMEGGIPGLLSSGQLATFMQVVPCILYPERLEGIDEEAKATFQELQEMLFEEYLPGGVLPGCFPPGILLAATWNEEEVYQCGRALGNESRFFGIDVLLGTPNVNIHRDPRNGRLFEGYSEDPHLVAALAPAFVRGVQDEGIIANVKHFAANNKETNRTTVNEKISERALHEIYLPGFKACVQEGGCKTVMSAYNAINGTPCAHNSWLLRDTLKDDWGFEGFVVSDWGAVYDQVAGMRGGNDVDMPGLRSIQPLIDAVNAGELDEALVDEAVTRFLRVLVDMPAPGRPRLATIDREASAKAAYEAARGGFVLLKNEDATLPLRRGSRVAVFGERSKKFIESGDGSAGVVTRESTSMLDTLVELLGHGAVSFGEIRPDTDTVVVTVGLPSGEGADRASLDLSAPEKSMLFDALAQAKSEGKRTVVVLNVCGPIDMREFIDDVDALVCVFITGMQGGRAAADLLCGIFSPSGKLPVTFAKRYEDYASSTNFPGLGNEVLYAEDVYVGYRHFDRWDVEPLFPFGHGLSYTTFSLANPQLSSPEINVDHQEELTLTAELTNGGAVAGQEVVQLYVSQPRSTRPKPPKQLKAFKKIEVQPGETVSVRFTVGRRFFEEYNELLQKWVVEPETYVLMLGTSSRELPCSVEVVVQGTNPYETTPVSNPLDLFTQGG